LYRNKHSQYSHPFIYEHNRGMLRLVSFTITVARFTKEWDKTNSFVKLKKQCTVEVLNKSVKKMTLVDFCIYMYGTCRTVSWNVIILNNINDNTVNSKQYSITGYNQSVTGCGSQRRHVVVTQRKLM